MLSAIFLCSFVLFVLPRFPDVMGNSGDREWFIVSWNLPGLLMFISNFRIQALRAIIARSARGEDFRITPWVRFWFLCATAFGVLTLAWLSIFLRPTSLPWGSLLSMFGVISLWLVVVVSSLIISIPGSRRDAGTYYELLRWERRLLGLTSFVFLIFTTFSTIAMSFPL
jgi:hypothetical protein